MIAYAKRVFRVEDAHKAFACLVGLWLFLFSCQMAGAETISTSWGAPRPPDYYLVGVDKIIVWASEPSDSEVSQEENKLGQSHIVPRVDFVALNRSIADQIRAALPEKMAEIQVESIIDSPLHSGAPDKDENALILHLTFGYHIAQSGDRQLVLGAVYPSIERLPPPELRQDRVSGIYRWSFIYVPVPFLMDGDESAINASILQATQKCVGKFAKWFAYMPSQMSKNGKDRH